VRERNEKKSKAKRVSAADDDAFDRALPGIVKSAFAGLRAQRRAFDAANLKRIREETDLVLKETPWSSFVPSSR
jgi:hypothetical protein